MQEIHITFDSKEAEEKLMADKNFSIAMANLIELASNINGRVGAEVIKPDIFKRINEKQQTHFWDNGEHRKICKNCYWFCKGDEGRFCMINLNIYLHKLFNHWDSQKCGCTSFEKGKHFFYG